MRRRVASAHAVPFVGLNHYRSIGGTPPALFVAVLAVGDGYFCVEYQIGISQVVAFVAKHEMFDWRYRKLTDAVGPQVVDLKAKALQYGATLEAIQLLGQLTPISKDEETMATAAKVSRKEGDAAALKAAASKAPVGGAKTPTKEPREGAPKRPGNPAALEAARAARNVDRPYKVVPKKANEGRENSWTARMIEIAQNNASTDDAKAELAKDNEFGERRMDFSWLKNKGYIIFPAKK